MTMDGWIHLMRKTKNLNPYIATYLHKTYLYNCYTHDSINVSWMSSRVRHNISLANEECLDRSLICMYIKARWERERERERN